MEFTLKEYDNLLKTLIKNNYEIVGYRQADVCNAPKKCILRHDIDMSVDKALTMSKIEKSNGCTSTYFVLLCTGFYNVFTAEIKKKIQAIKNNGCSIGLHFDEVKYIQLENVYGKEYEKNIVDCVKKECAILSDALDMKIDMVSMHRPSKKIIEENIDFGDILNSYSKEYFSTYKYLSDSRRRWRENIYDYINNGTEKLHVLTHPIWYSEGFEMDMKSTLRAFCNEAKDERFNYLLDNISDLESVIKREDI